MDFAQFTIDLVLFLIYSFGFILTLAWIWRFWMMYVSQQFMNEQNNNAIMLEILLPREINKSPVAFEMVATAFLQNGGVGTWYARNWGGAVPAQFSLEIVSLEGIVHFYIRTHKKFKSLIESNIYAQYPGVEVIQVEDYTKLFRYQHNTKESSIWGNSFVLSNTLTVQKEEKNEKGKVIKKKETVPGDFLPIRTYVDLGLDKDPKEEFKNDPITQIIEYLGSLGKNEYAGLQILLQDTGKFDNSNFPATYVNPVTHEHLSLKDLAKLREEQIRTDRVVKKGDVALDEYGAAKTKTARNDDGTVNIEEIKYLTDKTILKKPNELTEGEKAELEAIGNKLSKPLLRCVMRTMYVNTKGFNPNYIQNSLSLMKPFSYPGFNSFRPNTVTSPYDFNWQNTMKKRVPWRAEEFFDAYVEREGFHPHLKSFKSSTGEGSSGDIFFFPYPGYVRRIVRMISESIFHPFDHPVANEVFTLNLEELATIYHFPGQTAATPTLPRIDSRKGVAPTNLPQ